MEAEMGHKMLFDSHAHLDDEYFDEDRDAVIEKIRNSGVGKVVNIGCDIETSKSSITLAEKYNFIYAAVGFYPQNTENMTDADLSEIEKLSHHDKVVAIGEIGLDYHYDDSSRDKQKYWFKKQLELAENLDLPVVIHNRDSHEDMMKILRETSARGIIHCYSGSPEMAKQLINMGFYISFAGPVTYKNAVKTVESAKVVPLDKILIETDSPYLSPQGFRGQRNDSSHINITCERLAEIKGVSPEEMAEITFNNASKVYRIDNII